MHLVAVVLAPVVVLSLVLVGALPLRLLVKGMFFATFVVIGPLTYYAGFRSATWIPYVLALFILCVYLVKSGFRLETYAPPLFIGFLSLYLFELIVSTIGSGAPPGQILVGLKVYGPLWLSVLFLLPVIRSDPPRFVEWLERGALALGVISSPL